MFTAAMQPVSRASKKSRSRWRGLRKAWQILAPFGVAAVLGYLGRSHELFGLVQTRPSAQPNIVRKAGNVDLRIM